MQLAEALEKLSPAQRKSVCEGLHLLASIFGTDADRIRPDSQDSKGRKANEPG
jgi:hypothetical protein